MRPPAADHKLPSINLAYINRYKTYRLIYSPETGKGNEQYSMLKTLPFVSIFKMKLSKTNTSDRIAVYYSNIIMHYKDKDVKAYSYKSFLSNFQAADYYIYGFMRLFKQQYIKPELWQQKIVLSAERKETEAYLIFPRLPEDITNFTVTFDKLTIYNSETNTVKQILSYKHAIKRTNIKWKQR